MPVNFKLKRIKTSVFTFVNGKVTSKTGLNVLIVTYSKIT